MLRHRVGGEWGCDVSVSASGSNSMNGLDSRARAPIDLVKAAKSQSFWNIKTVTVAPVSSTGEEEAAAREEEYHEKCEAAGE